MALVDADHMFLYANVGATGSGSGGRVFAMTDLKEPLKDGSIGIPPAEFLPGGDRSVQHYIVLLAPG